MSRGWIWRMGWFFLLPLSCSRDGASDAVATPSASAKSVQPAAPSPSPSAKEPKKPAGAAAKPADEAPTVQNADVDPEQVPDGYAVMVVGGVTPTPHGNAVVLTDDGLGVGIPIFIGGTEALSIALRLRDERYARPLTHDLLDTMLGELGGKIESVRVDELVDNVFHGSVLVRHAGKVIRIDARPSDALALAVGNASPIFVARQVIEDAGISLDRLDMKPPSELDSPDEPRGVEL